MVKKVLPGFVLFQMNDINAFVLLLYCITITVKYPKTSCVSSIDYVSVGLKVKQLLGVFGHPMPFVH